MEIRTRPLPVEVEQFEDRTLLSVSAFFNPFTNALEVQSDSNDSIAIIVDAAGEVKIVANGGTPANPSTGRLLPVNVQSITVTGGPGDNFINLTGVTPAQFLNLTNIFVDGSHGHDTIFGSTFGDNLFGDDGNDFIVGGDGNDTINGEDGHDSVDGGAGNDSLMGGHGNDTVSAASGGCVSLSMAASISSGNAASRS